jgi:hypothetical protein
MYPRGNSGNSTQGKIEILTTNCNSFLEEMAGDTTN